MNSIFTNIYKYRQTAKKNDIENYLIEIFSDCLRKDMIFKHSFLNRIGIKDFETSISTQKTYKIDKESRPDICIENSKNLTLIECKVGADEGHNQLMNYQKILSKIKDKKTSLVFLTKYVTHNNKTDINITWSDISEMITDKNNLLTIELKKYLIENNISFMQNFTEKNLTTLKHLRETIEKMDIILDSIKKDFKEILNYSQESRNKNILISAYYDKVKIPNSKLLLDVGFFGFDTNTITVGVRFFSNDKSEISTLEKDFYNWKKQELDEGAWLGKYQIINSTKTSINECVSFINEALSNIQNNYNL